MLAAITQTPQLALKPEEAEKLAAALVNVQQHYKLPALSADKMALGMLFWTAATIYAPRVMAIAAASKGPKPPPPPPPAQFAETEPAAPSHPQTPEQRIRAAAAATPYFVIPGGGA